MKPAKKAKFRVGQVVIDNQGSPVKIIESYFEDGELEYYVKIADWLNYNESELRPLTAKEQGPRKGANQ